MADFSGKNILIGVTASISAYKSLILTRLLVKAGARVQVIMTPAARDFVGPLSFSTLSGSPVLCEIHSDSDWSNHVHLGIHSDLFVIAPACANTIAKMAAGMVDNLLTAVYLSARCPVIIAPAMDVDMWNHPATQSNVKLLKSRGVHIIPVADGLLASGLSGPGRLQEPEEIFVHISNFISSDLDLAGKKILITAGPTYEAIDPVRFVGNHSSGKTGIALAEECINRGAEVYLILGPCHLDLPQHKHFHLTQVTSAVEMMEAVKKLYEIMDYFILSAAVADYMPSEPQVQKIKKSNHSLELKLTRTPDIAAFLGKSKSGAQKLVGFALETENLHQNAKEKLISKNMDMIVLNSTGEAGVGFGSDLNRLEIITRSGDHFVPGKKSKKDLATDIVNALLLL